MNKCRLLILLASLTQPCIFSLFSYRKQHRRRSSVNFRGQYIFARKNMHEKTKCPNLHDSCPKNYQNTRICMIFARKINEIADFYTICARKNARILGGTCLTYPRLLRLWERAFLNFNFSAICQWLTSLSADDGLYVFRRLNQCESSGDGLAMARNGCGLQVYSRSRCVRQKCPIHTADATKLSSCVASAV